jgi:prepilin-type N-terminal cleavage/methylation domain-containing protein
MVEHGQSVQINPGGKMFKKMQTDLVAATFELLRLLLAVTIWSCHAWVAPTFTLCHGFAAEPHPQGWALKPKFLNPKPRSRNKFGMTKRAETNSHVMLNPESVMPNLFRHLFRAGLFQHLVCFFSAFRRRTFHPCPQDEVFRHGLNKPSNPRTLESLNPSGFTLIELIVVLVIIGILAATVLPRIDFGTTSSRASADGAANMIASDIRYAQEFAMANRVSKSVIFTNGSSAYTFNPASTGMDPSGQLQSIGATIGTTVTFTFNSLGEPTAGGGSSVAVSSGGQSRTITVVNYTGKVNIS